MCTRALLAATGILFLAACGADAPASMDADSSPAGTAMDAESGAAASSSGSEGEAPATAADRTPSPDRCAEARIDETATFDAEGIPFRFDYPAGWDHLARSHEGQRSGSLAYLGRNGRRSGTGLIQYVYETEPTAAVDIARQILERTGERITSLQIDGREVAVYGMADEAVVNAKFLYPDADGPHMVSLIFGAASDDCVPARERIRDLVLESLTNRG